VEAGGDRLGRGDLDDLDVEVSAAVAKGLQPCPALGAISPRDARSGLIQSACGPLMLTSSPSASICATGNSIHSLVSESGSKVVKLTWIIRRFPFDIGFDS